MLLCSAFLDLFCRFKVLPYNRHVDFVSPSGCIGGKHWHLLIDTDSQVLPTLSVMVLRWRGKMTCESLSKLCGPMLFLPCLGSLHSQRCSLITLPVILLQSSFLFSCPELYSLLYFPLISRRCYSSFGHLKAIYPYSCVNITQPTGIYLLQ